LKKKAGKMDKVRISREMSVKLEITTKFYFSHLPADVDQKVLSNSSLNAFVELAEAFSRESMWSRH
jgi:hypothetical protein